MIFYHYTAANRLSSIMESGLSRGEVPLTQTQALNAVWLTTDKSADGHGLIEQREMTDLERSTIFQLQGVMPEKGTMWDNKREVRITVKLPSSDRNLTRWITWGRKRLTPEWFDSLLRGGGGKRKAETWWLYWGVIKPDQFVLVEHLSGQAEPS